MAAVGATEYFVDAELGRDSYAGTSADQPWQTVRRVNRARLEPGATVRFRAGRVWRESLSCQSGAQGRPVTYTRYGEGPKPMLAASVDLASAECWIRHDERIWVTRPDEVGRAEPFPSFAPGDWGVYCDGNGLATISAAANEAGEKVYTLRCQQVGERSTNIQLNYLGIELEPAQFIRYRFRAKATKPFTAADISLMRAQSPWGAYGKVLERSTDIGEEWAEHEILFQTTISEKATDGRLSFFVGNAIPEGCEFSFVPLGAELVEYRTLGLSEDVGNIVLVEKGGEEESAGWKRWDLASLKNQGDFFHDPADRRLYFRSEANPGTVHSRMEAARKRVVVAFRNTSHVVVDGLAIAYTGAHGANGGACRHGTIRNCDFRWIGGSHLYTRNGTPTRYGNGVEFWDSCENMTVEGNTFEQIYDTAMTNQGRGKGMVRNMVWRGNRIYRCEQAYEIWFSNPEMRVEGLFFVGNECIDSGYGWGHVQRPNKNGCHLLAYSLECQIGEIRYEGNTFNHAKDAQIWFFNPRLGEVRIDRNTYIQRCPDPAAAKLFRWRGADAAGVTFDEYRKATGNDANSVLKGESPE